MCNPTTIHSFRFLHLACFCFRYSGWTKTRRPYCSSDRAAPSGHAQNVMTSPLHIGRGPPQKKFRCHPVLYLIRKLALVPPLLLRLHDNFLYAFPTFTSFACFAVPHPHPPPHKQTFHELVLFPEHSVLALLPSRPQILSARAPHHHNRYLPFASFPRTHHHRHGASWPTSLGLLAIQLRQSYTQAKQKKINGEGGQCNQPLVCPSKGKRGCVNYICWINYFSATETQSSKQESKQEGRYIL